MRFSREEADALCEFSQRSFVSKFIESRFVTPFFLSSILLSNQVLVVKSARLREFFVTPGI